MGDNRYCFHFRTYVNNNRHLLPNNGGAAYTKMREEYRQQMTDMLTNWKRPACLEGRKHRREIE